MSVHFSTCRCFGLVRRRASTVAVRRQLAPLIKLIHPDIFSTSIEKVKNVNLKFLQSLNELSDNIQSMIDMTNRRGSLDIVRPLPPSYRFSFYIKERSTVDSGDDTARAVTAAIITPASFTARRTLGKDPAEDALEKLLAQLGNLFTAAGLDNPWNVRENHFSENEDAMSPGVPRQQKNIPNWMKNGNFVRRSGRTDELGRDSMDVLMKQVKQAVEERMVEKEVVTRWDRKRGSAAAHAASILSEYRTSAPDPRQTVPYKSRHRNSRGAPIGNDGFTEMEMNMMLEIDRYFSNGNVLVSDMPSPKVELETTRMLRKFLVDYGKVLNFSFKSWHGVLIVLRGDTTGTADRRANAQAPSSENSSASDMYRVEVLTPTRSSEHEEEASSTAQLGGAAAKQKKLPKVVVTIPYNFKTRALLNYISKNVPQSKLMTKMTINTSFMI